MRKSGISGRGTFATRDFKKGEVICEFTGKRTSVPVLNRIYKSGNKRVSCDAFQIGVKEYLLIDEPWVLVNHSCNPNSAFTGECTMIAIKAIRAGEEFFYDYSATEWTPHNHTEYDYSMWPMKCHCGSANCRRFITCFPYLPRRTRDKYINSGVIQNHILAKLKFSEEQQRCDLCEKAIARLHEHPLGN